MDRRRIGQLWAYPIDLAIVVGFWVIYSLAQDQPTTLAVLLPTIFPFWLGLSLAWLVVTPGKAAVSFNHAVVVWAMTLIGGLLLRNLGGQATAMPLIVASSVVLSFGLLGWRLLGFLLARTRARPVSRSGRDLT